MFDSEDSKELMERAAVLSLVAAAGKDWEWPRIAQAIVSASSATKIIEGAWSGFEDPDVKELHEIATRNEVASKVEAPRSSNGQ